MGVNMLRLLAGALVLVLSPLASANAQTAPAPAAAPEPARLAAAQALIDRIMPAAQRDSMVEQMVRPMMENIRGAVLSGPKFETAKAENPKLVATIETFMKDEFEHSIATMKASMPAMFDAMARAYARRFTLDQLQAIDAFFQTPAGHAYVTLAPTVMADPDFLAVQRSMMTDAMTGMQQRMAALGAKIDAEAKQRH
ncbi:hypothetical protein ASE13_12360 [Sphingomonas sp. Root241]|nr:hypothetical protein ASE13_12360 [Sphingomonas sp. Root241]